MSRLRRIADHDRIFFITTNLAPGALPFFPAERNLLLESLSEARTSCGFLLFGFVLMPDHVHLLISPQGFPLPQIIHQWKFKTGYAISQRRGVHGGLWQARYFDFICRRVRDFWDKLDYIHQNPVEAKLVARPQDWPWSSYRHYARCKASVLIPDSVDLPADGNT